MFSIDTALGEIIVVELNNALDFTDTMEHSLLYTSQARDNGVEINDVPTKFKELSRFDVKFVEEGTSVLLQRNEPTPYIPIKYPMCEKLNECICVELTSYND